METQYVSIGKAYECTFGSPCQGLVMGTYIQNPLCEAKKHEKWEDVTAALAIGSGFPLSLEKKWKKDMKSVRVHA